MSGFCARREMASRYSLELKNFRLRRASKQPLSDVSRAGKQVCAGQKSVPQTHFVREPVNLEKGPVSEQIEMSTYHGRCRGPFFVG